MPILDGLEFITAFQALALSGQEDIVFLLLGVDSQPSDIDAFMELGVHEFTTKPLSKEKVREVYGKY